MGDETPQKKMKKFDPFTAFALSAIVLPGVGKLYNRQYVKGAILLALFTGVSLYLFYWVLVLGVIWLISVVDAYFSVKKRKPE